MEGQDIRGLIEAYSQVYETPEVLNEEVVEEDIEVLDEQGGTNRKGQGGTSGAAQSQALQSMGQSFKSFADRGGVAGAVNRALQSASQRNGNTNRRGQGSTSGATVRPTTPKPAAQQNLKGLTVGPGGFNINNKPVQTTPTKPAATSTPKPAAAAAAAPKPAAAAAPKPTTPASPTKPAPGTKAAGPESIKPKTPNPLMKDMPGATLKKAQETPKPQMSARAQALKAGGPAGSARERMLNQDLDLFDIIKGHLLDEGYAETEEGAMVIMVNMSEEWRETIIMELTGGKGHPGYKAGSKDHGDLEDHPAVKKGGVLTPRHGEHLGDLDDEDDEEDELENILKDRSRARREAVRKPLRDKVKAARKMITKEDLDQLTEISKELALKAHAERGTREFESDGDNPQDFTKSGKSKADESERRIVKKHGEGARREANRAAEKRIYGHNKYSEAQERENEKKKTKKEGYAVTIEDIVKLLDENREHDREMRKAAARERAEEKKERKEEGKKSAKAPGRLGKSAGSSYADYQEVSIKAHDKATKGKFIPGMVKNEEVELVDESALGTMAVLGGMAAGRAIHGKLEKRKAKKELEAKRKTSDYLIMKDKTKKVVARDRAASGDTRKEDLEAWVDELIAEGYDLSGYTWEEVAEIYAQELELMDEASYSAKAARAGKDIGKPGKAFAKIAKEAGERYGSKERGEKVAGAVLAKLRKEGYQRDPEKGEEKEDKKYENVRGEKTPMPPRGDKRREAFEKWYAKQMGR